MKIEKISENQIRCTLTKEDLISRQLRISELAYGSEKAKTLFKDMMQQAAAEYGFEADYIPLMIEAIPVFPDSLVLIVTKVEDPEELDTRFSSFTPSAESSEEDDVQEPGASADEILNCFRHIEEILNSKGLSLKDAKLLQNSEQQGQSTDTVVSPVKPSITKIYAFNSLEEVRKLSEIISPFYNGANTLYKNSTDEYLLAVHMSEHTASEFNKVCNIISEYGRAARVGYASSSYFEEHLEIIIADKAIQTLSKL